MATGIPAAFKLAFPYKAPVKVVSSKIVLQSPIVTEFWIKIPADIERNRECPANGTMTVRRSANYGDVLGTREDVVTIGLANSPTTGVGKFSLMLWFPRPEHLEPGSWAFDARVSDDCGGVGDLFNQSLGNPRSLRIPNVLTIPEPAP